MKKVYIFLLILIICLTGCSSNDSSEKNKNSNDGEKENAIKLNSELNDVEAFVIDNEDILGIKKDGTSVPIMTGVMKHKKMHSIDYSDGFLYVVQAETKMDYPTPNSRSKMLVVKKIWYERIDLTKGDGNYTSEKIYEYDNEDTGSTYLPAPNVYKDKMYIVKNANQIIAIDLNTKEIEVLDDEIVKKVDNVIYGAYIYLDKASGNLYYTGPIKDRVVLAKYNLETKEREILEDGKNVVYHFYQFTKDGLIFGVQHYEGDYKTVAKKYTYKDNKIDVISDKQTNSFYECGNNYVVVEDAGAIYDYDFGPHYVNISIKDKDFKEIKKVFEKVSDENGSVVWNYTFDKVEVSDGKKAYLLNCNSYELKEIGNMYTQVAIVR